MIFAFVNQKGGVGKTTTTVTLASALVARGRKVLLIDADPQESATVSLGASGRDGFTLYEALLGKVSPEACIVSTAQTGLFCLPASLNLAGIDVELANDSERFVRLKKVLSQLRSPFDLVFIDCPPSLGLLPVMALSCARFCVVPVQGEYLAMEGLSRVLRTIQHIQETVNPALSLFGILLNMVDTRTLLARQVEEELRQHFPEKLFRTVIPRLVRFAEAPGFSKPLLEFDPRSKASALYQQLTDEFLARLSPEKASVVPHV